MALLNNLFNKKSENTRNDYRNSVPEDLQYDNSHLERIRAALNKNNVTTVELFASFDSKELFSKLKNTNSSNDLLVFYKGHVNNSNSGYISVFYSKQEIYSLVAFQHQFIYEELFGTELWNDPDITPQKIHEFNCYMSQIINNFAAINCKIMAIGMGNINKKQYENTMEDSAQKPNLPSNKPNSKGTAKKAAIYTGVATTIGAGLIIGFKLLSNRNKNIK